jgi:predicted phage baseplate assembly protein
LDTRLAPGHAILIVGDSRRADGGSERWHVRVVAAVEQDRENNRTRVLWDDPLGHDAPRIEPESEAVQVFAFRSRAALFGHNAPDPRLMSRSGSPLAQLLTGRGTGLWWANYALGTTIDLDRAYPGVTAGSWLALVSNERGAGTPSLPGYTELYRAAAVSEISRSAFGLSGKITRVTPDSTENLDRYGLQRTLVLAESQELAISARPLRHPVYGDRVVLDSAVAGLRPGQALAVTGLRQRIEIAQGVNTLAVTTDAGRSLPLTEGDTLILTAAPAQVVGTATVYRTPEQFGDLLGNPRAQLSLAVLNRDGAAGTLRARGSEIRLGRALRTDQRVSEIVVIGSGSGGVSTARGHTALRLDGKLRNVYRRDSVHINANVAQATHGETVDEILGGGAADQPDLQFALKQEPLTHVNADTPSGRSSTLRVRVNDMQWADVPTLYGHGGQERVHTVHLDADGTSSVRFGDGVTGVRPPSGQNNVRATYRKGLGVGGNVAVATLTTLLSRPLGVDAVTNPVAAGGGENPEPLDRARDNAPLTVRTLDRAVSVEDYADYARAFAGIDKAHAAWVPAGPARGMFLTVAGIGGATVGLAATETGGRLLDSLRSYGDPLIPVRVQNYVAVSFRTRLNVKVGEEYSREKVVATVESALRVHFSFEQRSFGQNVTLDEVAAVAQGVDGVQAAHVVALYRAAPGAVAVLEPRLSATVPVVSLTAAPTPAELLTLSDAPLELGVMP